jgi:hypothetical protein
MKKVCQIQSNDVDELTKLLNQDWVVISTFIEDGISYTTLTKEITVKKKRELSYAEKNQLRVYAGRPMRMLNVHPDDPDYTRSGWKR